MDMSLLLMFVFILFLLLFFLLFLLFLLLWWVDRTGAPYCWSCFYMFLYVLVLVAVVVVGSLCVCRPAGWCDFFAGLCWNSHFLFVSVFAVFSNKTMRQPASYTVQKNAALSISHRFFRCFPICVAFRIGFYGVFADSRLFAPASFDLHFYLSSMWGWGGMGGGADDVHANAAYMYCFSFCSVHWWGGGGMRGMLVMLMLCCMMLCGR